MLILGDNVAIPDITCALDRVPGQRHIAIFDCTPQMWNNKLIEHLDEFVGWPCHREELLLRLRRLTKRHNISVNNSINESELLEEFSKLSMIGSSVPFVSALRLIKKIAFYDAPTLIQGETGTGKEMAARAMHYLGNRRDAPFIPVNCGAIPDDLLENELFGHEKGAYTDAKHHQPGVVELADGGTLFLDEIDALSTKAQVALLRLIQEKEYRPLGSKNIKQADIRIIAATNSDLKRAVSEQAFREDLLFRLNVLSITIPPLRERTGDIVLLANHLLDKFSRQYQQEKKRLHPDALDWMNRYPWPGNVRELENILHREFLFTEGPMLHFGTDSARQNRRRGCVDRRQSTYLETSYNHAKATAISTFERNYLHWLLEGTYGNVSEAARIAGKERRALGKLIKKHKIDRTQFKR